jgi:hypothetical protein
MKETLYKNFEFDLKQINKVDPEGTFSKARGSAFALTGTNDVFSKIANNKDAIENKTLPEPQMQDIKENLYNFLLIHKYSDIAPNINSSFNKETKYNSQDNAQQNQIKAFANSVSNKELKVGANILLELEKSKENSNDVDISKPLKDLSDYYLDLFYVDFPRFNIIIKDSVTNKEYKSRDIFNEFGSDTNYKEKNPANFTDYIKKRFKLSDPELGYIITNVNQRNVGGLFFQMALSGFSDKNPLPENNLLGIENTQALINISTKGMESINITSEAKYIGEDFPGRPKTVAKIGMNITFNPLEMDTSRNKEYNKECIIGGLEPQKIITSCAAQDTKYFKGLPIKEDVKVKDLTNNITLFARLKNFFTQLPRITNFIKWVGNKLNYNAVKTIEHNKSNDTIPRKPIVPHHSLNTIKTHLLGNADEKNRAKINLENVINEPDITKKLHNHYPIIAAAMTIDLKRAKNADSALGNINLLSSELRNQEYELIGKIQQDVKNAIHNKTFDTQDFKDKLHEYSDELHKITVSNYKTLTESQNNKDNFMKNLNQLEEFKASLTGLREAKLVDSKEVGHGPVLTNSNMQDKSIEKI